MFDGFPGSFNSTFHSRAGMNASSGTGRIALRRNQQYPMAWNWPEAHFKAGSAKDISVYPKVKRYYALS